MNAVFLAWRDRTRPLWFPVGRLSREENRFRFEYLRGALDAQRQAGFAPLISFPDLNAVYVSDSLFPMFQNRVMGSSRAEYPAYLNWLDLAESEAEPLVLLARGGGHRATDEFEIFPAPEVTPEGRYRTLFFLEGLKYMPEAARKRAELLRPEERLLLMRDVQNLVEPDALMFRTAETQGADDRHLLGFCPRYLMADLNRVLATTQVFVHVRRVNPRPAPSHVRVLCRLEAQCSPGFVPLAADIFQPLVNFNGAQFVLP